MLCKYSALNTSSIFVGLDKKKKEIINMDNKTNNIKTQSIRMRELDKQCFDDIKKKNEC